jgi:drug/metabolite transporter (DMT)-like permease
MRLGLRQSLPGIGTAFCFASSPVLVRFGLEDGGTPLTAVTVGLFVAVAAYLAIFYLPRAAVGLRRPPPAPPVNPLATTVPRQSRKLSSGVIYQLLAAIAIGLGTWFRYIAVDLSPLALVATLGRVNILVILMLTPFLLTGRRHRLTPATWLGAGLIILGSILVAVG